MSNWSAFMVSACLLLAGAHIAASDDPKPAATSPDAGFVVKLEDLEDYALKGQRFVINNFSLHEIEEPNFEGMASLVLNATVKDKNNPREHRQYFLMVVGLDQKKGIVWATKVAASAPGNGVGVILDQSTVPKGTLKGTASVWLRVIAPEGPPPLPDPCLRSAGTVGRLSPSG